MGTMQVEPRKGMLVLKLTMKNLFLTVPTRVVAATKMMALNGSLRVRVTKTILI